MRSRIFFSTSKFISPENIWKILIVALASFPLYSPNTAGFIIGISFIVSLILHFKYSSTKSISAKSVIVFFLLATPFFILIIGAALSSDFLSSLFAVEKGLALFFIPFAFLFGYQFLQSVHIRIALVTFIVCCFLLNTYALVTGLTTGALFNIEEDSIYFPLVRNLYVATTGTHLPYLGAWFMFATLAVVHLVLRPNGNIVFKIILVIIGIELILGTFLFSARMAIIAFVFSFALYVAMRLKSLKKTLIFGMVVLVSFFALSRIATISNRIQEVIDSNFAPPEGKAWDPEGGPQYNSINLRVGILICSVELLEENWLFGMGSENIQPKLNECYDQFPIEGQDDYKNKEYNTHNQFIHFWLATGVVGLVVFLFHLSYFFFKGFKYDIALLMAFIIFISISLLTENFLARYAGVMFYSFFITVLSIPIAFHQSYNTTKSHKSKLGP